MASQVAQTIAGEEYTIRPYRSGDLQAFLELDTVVWDREQSPEWFRWKYISNPFVDFVPIVVAEQDGEIVGSRPFMVFELRAGESTFIGYQPADTSVHPDHRRNGIFSSMTEFALTEYAGTEPDFYFNTQTSMLARDMNRWAGTLSHQRLHTFCCDRQPDMETGRSLQRSGKRCLILH